MTHEGVVVRPSRLPSAGDGLFATRSFAPGDIVCEYRGNVLSTREALQVADKSYLMRLGKDVYIDARARLDVAARYINDCRSKGTHNVVFEKNPAQRMATVRALQVIMPDDELFVDYGTWYWLAYNLAHKENPIK
ncbi:hypothetical protein ACHHYP_17184 [Achlya hypogyna]|uniref:SET domain-containing protein n=1 Tax=Achlya hypogyna TaxID=1202772 RepID=A0A1V9Y538_ACHHY|nr:hypothetical protein ACHHYP_17184 [Achlya hypogyna]